MLTRSAPTDARFEALLREFIDREITQRLAALLDTPDAARRADIVAVACRTSSEFLKGTSLAHEVLDVRFLGTDAAVLTSRGDTVKGASPKKPAKVQTKPSCGRAAAGSSPRSTTPSAGR